MARQMIASLAMIIILDVNALCTRTRLLHHLEISLECLGNAGDVESFRDHWKHTLSHLGVVVIIRDVNISVA